ncbi:MAG: L,D-transpeptidase [Niabella sp.]
MIVFAACNTGEDKTQPSPQDTALTSADSTLPAKEIVPANKPGIHYHFIHKKEWQPLKDSFEGLKHIEILQAINRVDKKHLYYLDSILVPDRYDLPLEIYLPFPEYVEELKDVRKILLFSYPTQVFAAYEQGKLVMTGPTSMGRKNKQTPQQLYFTNWKAKRTTSTVDDAWVLNWNFNVHNTWGVGFHEYALPGYPASHSCMRLLESDAKKLYDWADQWILKQNKLAASGTPVIVFGKYPFGEPRPWHKLAENPDALTISTDSLRPYIEPHLSVILEKQQQRQQVTDSAAANN